MFDNDMVSAVDLSEKLQKLMSVLRKVCEKRKVRVHVNKSKVSRFCISLR